MRGTPRIVELLLAMKPAARESMVCGRNFAFESWFNGATMHAVPEPAPGEEPDDGGYTPSDLRDLSADILAWGRLLREARPIAGRVRLYRAVLVESTPATRAWHSLAGNAFRSAPLDVQSWTGNIASARSFYAHNHPAAGRDGAAGAGHVGFVIEAAIPGSRIVAAQPEIVEAMEAVRDHADRIVRGFKGHCADPRKLAHVMRDTIYQVAGYESQEEVIVHLPGGIVTVEAVHPAVRPGKTKGARGPRRSNPGEVKPERRELETRGARLGYALHPSVVVSDEPVMLADDNRDPPHMRAAARYLGASSRRLAWAMLAVCDLVVRRMESRRVLEDDEVEAAIAAVRRWCLRQEEPGDVARQIAAWRPIRPGIGNAAGGCGSAVKYCLEWCMDRSVDGVGSTEGNIRIRAVFNQAADALYRLGEHPSAAASQVREAFAGALSEPMRST